VEQLAPEMADADLARALLHLDRCIDAYVKRCRERIPEFVHRHFSLKQTWAIQRRTLWVDLCVAPLNSAWAVPYLTIKKACGALATLGVPFAATALSHLPPGIRTGYERRIEELIRSELLEWDLARDLVDLPRGLMDDLRRYPEVRGFRPGQEPGADRPLRTIVQNYLSGRAAVSSVAGTLLTIACGWFVMGSTSVTVQQIAGGLAQRNARNRAVSRFFLGRRVGSAFYHVFPPQASQSEKMILLVVLIAAITVGALVCTILSDPIRKMAGVHERHLSKLVDDIEREVTILLHKRVKRALTEGTATSL
jgi:hypothetical protein